MCTHREYQFMLAAVRRRIDDGYSPESAHAAIERDWKTDTEASCNLYEDALDYATLTYGLED
jgi:hypothetical protein